MALVASAETAQDIASGFNKFLEPVSEYSAEITGLISVCFALSSALRELADAISEPRREARYFSIKEDLQTLLRSLDYTFKDVHRLFGGLGRPTHISPSAGYRQVWRDIDAYFQEESNNSLSVRLKFYRMFLEDIISIIYDGFPPNDADYDDVYYRIEALLDEQEYRLDRLDSDMNNLSLGALGPSTSTRERSFERRRPRRPSGLATDLLPRRPIPDLRSPLAATLNEFVNPPPVVPEVPNSPTTTASTSTFSNPSSSNSSAISHWVPKVFEHSPSTTPFKSPGHPSACYAKEMAPGMSSRLTEDYEKLIQLPFENGDLVVRLYIRSADQRARIHCRNMRHNTRKQYCSYLTSLLIEREKSTLRLSSVGQSGRTKELWACLRFLSYERLVLFFCTFLAMKAEDTENSSRQIEDHELRGEKLIYSGKIVDDQFEHALRLFQDRDSDGIRLQASVLRGELKRKPVWTAFITHQISSRRWMHRASSKTIHLADLHPYIFDSDYVRQLGPGGEHELRFANSSDAEAFVLAIKDVQDGL